MLIDMFLFYFSSLYVHNLKSEKLYFAGLLPPSDIQSEITRIKEFFRDKYGITHALKSPPHITMIPPFKRSESEEDLMIRSLENFTRNESCFTVTLENFGSFPPRVIFIEIKKNEILTGLYERLNKYILHEWKIVSEEKQDRPFNPHLTVAFRDLRKDQFHDAWPQFNKRMIRFEFNVTGLTLLKHTGKLWNTCFFSPFSAAGF